MIGATLGLIASAPLLPGMRGVPASRAPSEHDFLVSRDNEVKRVTSPGAEVSCMKPLALRIRAKERGWTYDVGYNERGTAKRKHAMLRWTGIRWEFESGDTSRCSIRLDR